jgi:hypothetical protein
MTKNKPIDIEIISITLKSPDCFVVKTILEKEKKRFEFKLFEVSGFKLLVGDDDFGHFARNNSEFQDSLYKLVQQKLHGKILSFPIQLRFK